MAFPRVCVSHVLPLALVGVVLGCAPREGVNSYDVPKTTEPGRKGGDATGDYRLLGLMVPAENPVWFFKYNGPADEITRYEADFDNLAATVALDGGKLDYVAPAGWKKAPGRGTIVYATIVTEDGKQEVSISRSAGGVKTNLDRWIGQIGLKPGINDEAKYAKVIDGKGVKILRVDLRGPKDPTTKRGGMMPAGHP